MNDPHSNHKDPATQILRCVAGEEDDGARADVTLGRHIEALSRRVAKSLALEGKLRIDGAAAKPATKVSPGQVLELLVPLGAQRAPELTVLHESTELVFVHKPAGLHTVALRPGQLDCLSAGVVARFPECASASEDPREGGALHRLDRATSGVVAFARTREAWVRGRAAFTRGDVIKDYIARSAAPWPPRLPDGELGLVSWLDEAESLDRPPGLSAPSADESGEASPTAGATTFRLRAALGPAETRGAVRVRLDGQRATTFAAWLATLDTGDTLVHLRLSTGHRHQARVHMAWAGLPLWGDELYGGAEAPRLGLHAYALDISCAFEGTKRVIDPHSLADWASPALDGVT